MSPSRSDSWDATGGASMVCSAVPSIGRTSGDIDGLDVDELSDAIAGELASIAALLHTAEGEPRVGSHDLVHKDRAALDPLHRDTLTAREIAGQDAGAEAEHRIVGSRDRRLVVLDWDDRRDRTEQLLSLAKTSSDSLTSTEIRQSVHRPKTPSLVGGRRPASLDRRPCTVTPESMEDGERAGWAAALEIGRASCRERV